MKERDPNEGNSSELILIKRGGGDVIEVREKPLSPLDNLVAEVKFLLGRFDIGYAARLCYWRHPKDRRSKLKTVDVLFADFKASPQPDQVPPSCFVCDSPLIWKPSSYAFASEGFNYVVPEIGWWKCINGHPGKILMSDFQRYASLSLPAKCNDGKD